MEQKTLMNWQAIGIGTLTGIIVPATIFVFRYILTGSSEDINDALRIIPYGVIFGVIGALIGKSSRKTWQAIVIGAIAGSLFLILVIFALRSLVYSIGL